MKVAAGPSWVAERYGVTVDDVSSPVGLRTADLLRLALRRNPKRAQLLVSTVLGKHLAADPRVIVGFGRLLGALVGRELADRSSNDRRAPLPREWIAAARQAVSGTDPAALAEVLDHAGDVRPGPGLITGFVGPPDLLVFGFAETATSLGQLVADQLHSDYLHSTRRTDGGTPVAAQFSELHSHATGHLLRPTDPGLLASPGPLILVDDELSTGRTALNVIEALHGGNPRPRYVLAGLVDVRSEADDRNRAALAERLGCRIDVVSLVRGSVLVPGGTVERVSAELAEVSADLDNPSTTLPGIVSRILLPWPGDIPQGGRHGFMDSDRARFDVAVRSAGAALSAATGAASRVLVIGTEEFMYLPLRLALELAGEPGRQVAFQSTTRSPVHAINQPGYPILRSTEFLSRVLGEPGDVVTRYVYNAHWPDFGTPDDGETGLVEADLIVIVDDGHAFDGSQDMRGVAGAVAAVTGAPVLLAVLA